MDFELGEDLALFQQETRAWVDREAPKSWARELERNEAEWPFELFDKLTRAGFHGDRDRRGVRRPGRRTSSSR